MPNDLHKIASQLIDADPLKVRPLEDGSLVVIAPTGQKYIYSPEQVSAVTLPPPQSSPPPKPDPPEAPKPRAKSAPQAGA